jgi:hypothetical protein
MQSSVLVVTIIGCMMGKCPACLKMGDPCTQRANPTSAQYSMHIAETRESICTYVNRVNHPHPFRKESFDCNGFITKSKFRKVRKRSEWFQRFGKERNGLECYECIHVVWYVYIEIH